MVYSLSVLLATLRALSKTGVVAELRVQAGLPVRSRAAPYASATTSARPRILSSRTLAWLSTRSETTLDDAQRTVTARLVMVNPTVATAVQLAQRFATMIRDRHAAALEGWLDEAAQCGSVALRSFANGIRADQEAVHAALSVPWSNGRTEGCVNRLKCVKRQMYGRGKLDLLRLRLIGT